MSTIVANFQLLKWGVAGCGRITNDFVGALNSEPEPRVHRFVAAAARSVESAREFSAKHAIERAYGSYRELAEDSDVQVVYVGNWNMDHFAAGKLFLDHGKHVLIEKPLTMNAKQTRALVAHAREKGLFLMEALWSRFTPAYSYAFKQIRAGAIGQVLHVRAELGAPIGSLAQIANKESGGGGILNLGCYPINLVLQANDNRAPDEIKVVGHLNQNGIDKAVVVAFKYNDGGTATISMDVRCELANEGRITGSRGYVQFSNAFQCPEELIVNGQVHSFPLPPTNFPMNYGSSSGLRFQAEEVRRRLLEGAQESLIMSHEHSILVAEIEDEIRKQLGIVFQED